MGAREEEGILALLDGYLGVCECQSVTVEKHDVAPPCERRKLAQRIVAGRFYAEEPVTKTEARQRAEAKKLAKIVTDLLVADVGFAYKSTVDSIIESLYENTKPTATPERTFTKSELAERTYTARMIGQRAAYQSVVGLLRSASPVGAIITLLEERIKRRTRIIEPRLREEQK